MRPEHRAYRPTWKWLWLVPAVGLEVLLYLSYGRHDADIHWLTHFLVGTSAALLLMTAWTWRTGRPVRWPLLWVLLGHLYAMVPDLLFNNFGEPHEWWMEIFLFHISSHFVPGRDFTWLLVFAVALGLYLATIGRVGASRAR